MNRPAADLSTIIGVSLIVATICAAGIIVILNNPTLAVFGGLVSAGATLIGVLERPTVANAQIRTSEPVTLEAPTVVVAATPEKLP